MKRILAALKGKVEKQKLERKMSRAIRAIETAMDNARDAIDKLEEEKMILLASLADATEVNNIISRISDKIGDIEEQEDIIARLEKVRVYIEEEVEIEDDEEHQSK